VAKPTRKQVELSWNLDFIYFRFAETYLDAGGELGEEIVRTYLPGQVFSLSVQCGWRPEPKPGNCWLGDWPVTKKQQDDFLDDLPLEIVENWGKQPTPPWVNPTPAMILEQFQDDTKLTNADIVRKMNQLRHTCDMKTFLRIKHPPKAVRATRIETILRLHQVIVGESPELFKGLNYRHLFWRRKS
jgi:hypothetical protein